jgi:AraC-like DNA-binding protein
MEAAAITVLPGDAEAAMVEAAATDHFETDEPESAVRELTTLYGPHSLHVVPTRPFDACVSGFELAHLHLARIRFGTEVVTTMDCAHPRWVFSYVRSGEVRRTRTGDVYTAGEVGVGSPDEIDQLVLSADTELVNLRIDEEDMRAACRGLLGEDCAADLCFQGRAAAGTQPVETFMRVVRHLANTPRFDHPGARRHAASVRDAVLYELLLGWPNTAAEANAAKPALPQSTHRARDYIHAHAADAPSVTQVAAAAGIGVRALGLGFEKHFGVSPSRYLLQVRLDAVRARLRSAGPGDTVTRAAFEWGFTNLGEFAARYRERFGESPRETLHREVH